MKVHIFASILVLGFALSNSLMAGPLAFGGGAGMEVPFAHTDQYNAGISAEAFWRKDEYELRFHFADTETQSYSLLATIKYFLSNSTLRPYLEAGLGPTIVDPKDMGLAYGVRPEVSLGADLGLNKNLSFGFVTRYFGAVYAGDTHSGKWEANHGLDFLANAIVWF